MEEFVGDECFAGDTLVDIHIYYRIDKNKSGRPIPRVLTDEEAEKLLADEATKGQVRKLETQWIQQSWESSQELYRRSRKYDHETQSEKVDGLTLRDSKLKMCMVGWNAKDKTGADKPCNEHTIAQLHEDLAWALLMKYENQISVPADRTEKN
jgi:hypothetical protein